MSVYDEIVRERQRQDKKFGGAEHDDNHTLAEWKLLIKDHLSNEEKSGRTQLVEVAALAVAAVESMDRNMSAAEGG